MSKILIALEVPAINEKYDVFVPDFMTIGELTILLAKAVSDMTQNQYVSSGKEVLLYRSIEGYVILNKKYTVFDYGFKNGDVVYIF